MEQLVFIVEWGVWTGYFAKKYLPVYDFSGHLEVENGEIERVEKIIFPMDTWGPFIFSKQFAPYGKTDWHSTVRNAFDGLRVTASVTDGTVLHVITQSGSIQFTPALLRQQGHIVAHAGQKYSMAILHVEPDNPAWRLPGRHPGEARLYGEAFGGRQADFFGVKGLILPPRSAAGASFDLQLPGTERPVDRGVVRLLLRFLISASPAEEKRARGLPRFSVILNGREVYQNRKFTTYHDTNSQFLEEAGDTLPVSLFKGIGNRVEIVNHDGEFSVLIQMVRFMPEVQPHMQVTSCLSWVVTGVPFCVSVRCNERAAKIRLDYDEELFEMRMPGAEIHARHQTCRGRPCFIEENDEFIWEGEHEFFFVAKSAFAGGSIRITDVWNNVTACAVIREGWDVPQESIPMKTGVEIKTGSPWEYEETIRAVRDGQLGNLIVFRDYHNRFTHYEKLWESAAACRKYGFFTDAVCMKDQDIVAAASADRCQCVGGHECTGIFYGARRPEDRSATMREAEAISVNLLRTVASGYRIPSVPVATGDASGGSRFAYLAGFDMLRHETFVGHHLLTLPNARGCARAFGKKIWGAHVASQHNAQPELEDGLRRFRLGLFFPWVFGANFVFEEDSLFICFKYYRMVGDDFLTRGKREICAAFHKYTQTHPRLGSPQVDIAVLQGRFAPPFNGISTTNDAGFPKDEALLNENFPVWGMAGRKSWEWGYRQPEKGYHLLEILSPGIYLNPLNQDAGRVRKFFGSDPHGEFDFLPVEAGCEVFRSYQLLLLLSWHTMEPETTRQEDGCSNDYEKLMDYAKNGGTLFLSVPHLTTRADRDFLRDMDDLRLIYDGDVADLCGVRITGKSGTCVSGARGVGDFRDVDFGRATDLLRLPNTSPDEDGDCRLADIVADGAEVVAEDSATGRPLIVRNRVGSGSVYLLCAYAYPGHEALKVLMPNLLEALIARHVRREVTVTDCSADIYWSVWRTGVGTGKIYLLNTDWTSPGNIHEAEIRIGSLSFRCDVREGAVREVAYADRIALYTDGGDAGITLREKRDGRTGYLLSGFGVTTLSMVAGRPVTLTAGGETYRREAGAEPFRLRIDLSKSGGSVEVVVS